MNTATNATTGGREEGTAMPEAFREIELAGTTLGDVATWPENLRAAADICLTSRFPMAILWGPASALLYNEAYVALIGDKHPDALGRPAKDVLAESWHVVEPLVRQVHDEGTATWSEDELIVLDRHGFLEECYFTFSLSPIRDEDGNVSGLFNAVTETTDRVLVDRQLRTLGLLAEHTRDAQTVREAGQGAIRALAAVPAEVPFAHLYVARDGHAELIASTDPDADLPHDLDLDGDPWQLGEVLRDGEERLVELPPDRDEHTGSLQATPTASPASRAIAYPVTDVGAGEPLGVLLLGLSPSRPFNDAYRGFFDLVASQTAKGIVDARTSELERDRVTALAELNRAKTEFFSNVSHEFRTPLTLLHGPLLEALSDPEHPLPDEQANRVRMAQRNAERLGKLVNTLLDFSLLDSGRINASYRATDLPRLTRELASLFPSAVENAGLSYHVDTDPLPQSVYLDRDMWEKIVFNLLSNAIKFTREGSVTVRLRDGGDHAVFEVEDTGIGVASDQVPQLFERFHRVRATGARNQEGTGIGLSLVQELAALHGGTVHVDTELDRGSTFSVHVPYGTAHLPQDQIDADAAFESTAIAASAYVDEGEPDQLTPEELREASGRSDVGTTGGAQILIVDDNTDMRRYLTRVLEVHWDVRTASDGEAALRIAREERPDLVLSDVIMPGLDGFELLDAMRCEPGLEDVPFVLLSARASETSRIQGLDGGADDYLVKPFTIAELIARIRTNLRLAQQRAQTADVRARHSMLAGLSHEMQTPLAAILGSLAVLEQESTSDNGRAVLDIMRRQSRQLRGLIQQFLDLSRLEANREPVLHLESLDANELIRQAVEVCGNDRVRLVEHDGDVPLVRADGDRVEQILTNLCTNALKFSGDDEPVLIDASPGDDGTVVIRVRDHGVGIAAEEAELVFEKFYRGRAGDEVDGTGLGLYVSRALAEVMGGKLTLEHDTETRGATFALTLPAG